MAFGFDPSIILSGMPRPSPEPSLTDTLRTLGDLATSRAQQQHVQAQLGDMLRKQTNDATLADIYRRNAPPEGSAPPGTPGAVFGDLMRAGQGEKAYAAQDQEAQMATQEAQKNKALQDIKAAQRKRIGELFFGVTKDPTRYPAALKELASDPDPMMSVYASKLPAQFDPAVVQRLEDMGLSVEKRTDLQERGLDRIAAEKRARIIAGDKAGAANLEGTIKLRDAIDKRPEVKKYRQASAELSSLKELAKESTGANDMALVFAFMKAMDPDSVVRESEYAAAEATGKPTDRMMGLVSKYWTGGRLSPGQKQAFIKAAEAAQSGHKTAFNRAIKTYTYTAKKRGYDLSELGLDDAALGEEPAKVRVSNGKETREIDAVDVEEAARDGFKRLDL